MQKLIHRTLFIDPTGKGIINHRFHMTLFKLMDFTELTSKEKKEIHNLLLLISVKLGIVWNHYNKYSSTEDSLIKKVLNAPNDNSFVEEINYSQDLFSEFDGFLVQIKSTLDYIVKIPSIVLGWKHWNLTTFGEKGEKVIRALQKNMPRKWAGQAKILEKSIIGKHTPWLKSTIEARDKINHFLRGGISLDNFIVYKSKVVSSLNENMLYLPMWTPDVSIRRYMEVTWWNLFSLAEQFIAVFITLKLKSDYGFAHVPVEQGSTESPVVIMTIENYDLMLKHLLKKDYKFENLLQEEVSKAKVNPEPPSSPE